MIAATNNYRYVRIIGLLRGVNGETIRQFFNSSNILTRMNTLVYIQMHAQTVLQGSFHIIMIDNIIFICGNLRQ